MVATHPPKGGRVQLKLHNAVINASKLVQRMEDFQHLRDIIGTKDPAQFLCNLPFRSWSLFPDNHWTSKDDSMLLYGISLYGWGQWDKIKNDKALNLFDKLSKSGNSTVPSHSQLNQRAESLFSVLRKNRNQLAKRSHSSSIDGNTDQLDSEDDMMDYDDESLEEELSDEPLDEMNVHRRLMDNSLPKPLSNLPLPLSQYQQSLALSHPSNLQIPKLYHNLPSSNTSNAAIQQQINSLSTSNPTNPTINQLGAPHPNYANLGIPSSASNMQGRNPSLLSTPNIAPFQQLPPLPNMSNNSNNPPSSSPLFAQHNQPYSQQQQPSSTSSPSSQQARFGNLNPQYPSAVQQLQTLQQNLQKNISMLNSASSSSVEDSSAAVMATVLTTQMDSFDSLLQQCVNKFGSISESLNAISSKLNYSQDQAEKAELHKQFVLTLGSKIESICNEDIKDPTTRLRIEGTMWKIVTERYTKNVDPEQFKMNYESLKSHTKH
eukprot:TRINITY_DN287_c1_g1_i1.p1 TRINITY_DN287_c1_g1~~TRINITY_DN287_c1_g1_i1.p1  ORF type:complete len:490 (+),score=147.39 TRINITY_DN287_c1_g1_i1:89-1558(+)